MFLLNNNIFGGFGVFEILGENAKRLVYETERGGNETGR
jgi:hypothetical protein